MLIQFGKYIKSKPYSGPNTSDVADTFTLMKHYMRTFQAVVTGGYTTFGVFEIYNDSILSDLINMTCSLILAIDLDELDGFPKVYSLVFATIGPIAANHCNLLVRFETATYGKVLQLLARGLQSDIKSIITVACASFDKIFSRHIKNLMLASNSRPNPLANELEPMALHLENHRHILNSVLIQFINIILTVDNIHWTVAKPLLSLIIISTNEFNKIQQLLISSQAHDPAKAQMMQLAFAHLMEEIQPNIEEANKERFTSQVGAFRTTVTAFIDLSAFYKTIIQFTNE